LRAASGTEGWHAKDGEYDETAGSLSRGTNVEGGVVMMDRRRLTPFPQLQKRRPLGWA